MLSKLHPAQMDLDEANAFVARFHRHHKPLHRVKWSVGCADDTGQLRGVAMVGRPVARLVNHKTTLEVSRLVTDGCPNACSFLYGLVARIARLLGYQKVQTYILAAEPGTSLKAAGWKLEAHTDAKAWAHTDGRPRRQDQPNGSKQRWAVAVGKQERAAQ
ncbi:MAG: XF1762 family protein [Thermoplasmatota archaeon]